jgi:hypothetical protein
MTVTTDKYNVLDLPEGECGEWSIRRFRVAREHVWRQIVEVCNSGRYVPPGYYTGLFRRLPSPIGGKQWEIIMSDTPDEIKDIMHPVIHARGKVLIAGLGLGVVLNALAMKSNTTHITVIEQSSDVLTLVREHYGNKYPGKITFIQANIFEWKPPKNERWNYAWFDIWDTLNLANLPQMAHLHRRFCRKADQYGSWGQKFLQREARRHRAPSRIWCM